MPTVRDALLPPLDLFRGLLDKVFGFRQYDVTLVVNTWTTGGNPSTLAGRGTKVQTLTPILVHGNARPKVEQVSQKDIIISHGRYQDQDLRIGPLTPAYTDANGNPAGTDVSVFDPAAVGPHVEVLFLLRGPGDTDGGGDYYKLVEQEDTHPLRYTIVVRRTGQAHA